MTILSVHLGHNSSICLLKNGHVKKYFLIERLTRKKYDYDEKVVLSLVKNICQKLKIDIICISNFNKNKIINKKNILNFIWNFIEKK